jgi:hypothetical protein
MKWYKRFSDFSLSRQAFEISPLAHLVYSVLCDTVARSGENGELLAADIDDPSYLARLCNMQLLSSEVIDLYLESTPEQRESVLNLKVCSVETLQKALKECVRIGLIKRTKPENVELYVIDGFTKDNPVFINPESVKKRKHRGKFQKSGTVPGHGVDGTGQPPSRREEKREEKKIKEKKPKALSPKKPATGAESEKPSTLGFDFKALTNRLMDIFQEVRGQKYLHGGAKDMLALDRLRKFEPDEIAKRWRRGLEEKVNPWLQVNTFAQLAHKFNDLGAPPVQPKALLSMPKPDRPKVLTKEERAELLKDRPPIRIEVISSKQIEENLDGRPEEDENNAWGQS